MNKEQLEALRRQVEEDYRLDLAAIERLQQRFLGARTTIPGGAVSNSVPANAYTAPSKWSEEPEPRAEPRAESRMERPEPAPPSLAPADRQRERDEAENALRNLFNGGRPIGR